jgi:hypothetical protein
MIAHFAMKTPKHQRKISKPARFSWEGCDCVADSCATRGVSGEHIRQWICKPRTTKPLRKKIKQACLIQLNRSG